MMLDCRGMAVEDPKGSIAWKGKKYASVLADYPYADDGMLIWNALHQLTSDYLQVTPEASADAAAAPIYRMRRMPCRSVTYAFR